MTPTWPEAEADSIGRLRALAAGLGATVTETFIDAPFDTVWAVASDLEGELPHLITDVRSVKVLSQDADRCVALISGHSRLRARFDVVLRPGWCVMQSRFVIGGMAAVDTGHGTRFALLGGLRGPGARAIGPALGGLGRLLGARMMERFEGRVRRRTLSSRSATEPVGPEKHAASRAPTSLPRSRGLGRGWRFDRGSRRQSWHDQPGA
jgi:hypothetical protein